MDNVNKLSLPTTILIASILLGGFYYASQLSKQKSIEKQQQIEIDLKKEQETKEEQNKLNLQTCLDESEYQVTSSHLWLCSSIGRTEKSCGDVFAQSKNVFDSLINYRGIFGFEKTIDDFDRFSEECNCGLEKYRRDEFDTQKKDRDNICFRTYGD